jgi:hypothetical protein
MTQGFTQSATLFEGGMVEIEDEPGAAPWNGETLTIEFPDNRRTTFTVSDATPDLFTITAENGGVRWRLRRQPQGTSKNAGVRLSNWTVIPIPVG